MSNMYPLAKFMRIRVDIDILEFNQHHFLRTTTFEDLTYSKVQNYQKTQDDIDALTEEAIHEYQEVKHNC